MRPLLAQAPGKLNLCLLVGPVRNDGLHEIASLFESVSLTDTLTARESATGHDRVICDAVAGENLVTKALAAARERGLLSGPALELTIDKRVPIAAGMGGGSADAAAALRLAAAIEQRPLADYEALAFALGADVPSQLAPGAAIVHGAGERVAAVDADKLERTARRAYVIIEQQEGLSTADVFRQSDRSGHPQIKPRTRELIARVDAGPDTAGLAALIENDLQPSILALRPELSSLPDLLREHGAIAAAFTGSGPTCFGIFEDHLRAEGAALELIAAGHLAHAAVPVDQTFAAPIAMEEDDR